MIDTPAWCRADLVVQGDHAVTAEVQARSFEQAAQVRVYLGGHLSLVLTENTADALADALIDALALAESPVMT